MKRWFTYSMVLLFGVLVISGCRKERFPVYIDEGYWLTQERGVVVYSDVRCDYFIVETFNGYSVLRSWDGYIPYQGDVLYGDFSHWGVRDFYNRSAGSLTRSDVKDYWLSYFQAQDQIDYYCY